MNKEFCINCGHKNVFEVTKPKFCAGCGSPFNTSSKSTYRAIEVQQEEEEIENISFDLQKLKASIIAENNNSKRTLDDLWKDPAPRDSNSRRSASSDPSGEEILKKTMTECARVKSATDIDE
jgi:ribosomal protein L37E